MKAIFYHVPGPGARELLYIDPQTAQIKKIEARENESINTVVADFHFKYKSAVSLKDHEWEAKTREIAAARAKLAQWSKWAQADPEWDEGWPL